MLLLGPGCKTFMVDYHQVCKTQGHQNETEDNDGIKNGRSFFVQIPPATPSL
jgi:hypothetical protein